MNNTIFVRPRKCSQCQGKTEYSQNNDAYFCKKCDLWLEVNCGDKHCTYCFNRPEKPSEVNIPKPIREYPVKIKIKERSKGVPEHYVDDNDMIEQ